MSEARTLAIESWTLYGVTILSVCARLLVYPMQLLFQSTLTNLIPLVLLDGYCWAL